VADVARVGDAVGAVVGTGEELEAGVTVGEGAGVSTVTDTAVELTVVPKLSVT